MVCQHDRNLPPRIAQVAQSSNGIRSGAYTDNVVFGAVPPLQARHQPLEVQFVAGDDHDRRC